jgi:uncharacterized protein
MLSRIQNPLRTNSFFMFGARGTGKSAFLKSRFGPEKTLWIDLLDPQQEDRYALRPEELLEQIRAGRNSEEWIVIDAIQKVPKLLNVVHSAIENHGSRFAMTGSSARRLKRESVNLLAGRAFVYHLFPLTSREMGGDFDCDMHSIGEHSRDCFGSQPTRSASRFYDRMH